MLADGQHRNRNWRLNLPEKRNCFFCCKDKQCTLIQLPPAVWADWQTKSKDEVVLKIAKEIAHSNFACCADCKKLTNGQKGKVIAQHLVMLIAIEKEKQ